MKRPCVDTRVELAEHVRVTVTKEKVIKVAVEDRDPQMAADIAAYFVANSGPAESYFECQ